MPTARPGFLDGWRYRCLHCHEALAADDSGLRCAGCGRHYPVRGGVPLLVKDPAAYVRSERAALAQAIVDARRRAALPGHGAAQAAPPSVALERQRDVAKAEAAQAEMLLALLDEPSVEPVADGVDALEAVRPGWSFDTLVPYLLRDWAGTTELRRTAAVIGAALRDALPDARGKSVVFAGCGAGGLLAHVPPEFARVMGFDLTLPILAAARRLLDGHAIDLPLARAMRGQGSVRLRGPENGPDGRVAALAAMDALDIALAHRSVDCVVTVFLTDILPDPRALADEIGRVLADDGIWINYGPSGNNLRAPWRFDAVETSFFLRAAGFAVTRADARRVTNLDISEVCPSVSHRSVVCYLTVSRKSEAAEARPTPSLPDPKLLARVVPQHFSGARLIQRLEGAVGGGVVLEHDRAPGRPESWELGGRAARIMVLVDSKRTVGEIADLLHRRTPTQSPEQTLAAFARFFAQGLLGWGEE